MPNELSAITWLLPLIILEGILKGIALWKSAKNNQLKWFIAIFIFNTIGVLPLVYLKFFQKNTKSKADV